MWIVELNADHDDFAVHSTAKEGIENEFGTPQLFRGTFAGCLEWRTDNQDTILNTFDNYVTKLRDGS